MNLIRHQCHIARYISLWNIFTRNKDITMYRTMVTKTQEDFLETKTVERRSLFIDVTGQSRCSSQGSALAASVTLPEYHPCNLLDGKTKFSAFPSRACKHRDIPRKKPRHILARDTFSPVFSSTWESRGSAGNFSNRLSPGTNAFVFNNASAEALSFTFRTRVRASGESVH